MFARKVSLIDGTPQVEPYEVANSTFHKIAAAAVPEADRSLSLGVGQVHPL